MGAIEVAIKASKGTTTAAATASTAGPDPQPPQQLPLLTTSSATLARRSSQQQLRQLTSSAAKASITSLPPSSLTASSTKPSNPSVCQAAAVAALSTRASDLQIVTTAIPANSIRQFRFSIVTATPVVENPDPLFKPSIPQIISPAAVTAEFIKPFEPSNFTAATAVAGLIKPAISDRPRSHRRQQLHRTLDPADRPYQRPRCSFGLLKRYASDEAIAPSL